MRIVMVQDVARRKTFSGAGRKRKEGAREPSGRPQRQSEAKVQENVMGVAKAQRVRFVPEKNVLDTGAGYPLGIYLIRKWITADEKAAGEEFASRVAAVKRDYDAPKADPAPGFLARLAAGETHPDAAPPPDMKLPDELVYSPDELRRRKGERLVRYNKAFEALHDAGKPALKAVNDAAIYERHIRYEDVPVLKRGLQSLLRFFRAEGGLTSSPCAR